MGMILKRELAGVMVGAILASAAAAHGAVVAFSGAPATNWSGGTFSSDLSAIWADGFYPASGTSAYNGFGQNGESISWTAATTLNSLHIAKCATCYDTSPIAFTASLYDVGNNLLASKTVGASFADSRLTFDTANVSRLTLTFTGGSDAYGDGRRSAWYTISDITYGIASAPEPAVWTMMILGFGMAGMAVRRRRFIPLA